MSQIAEAELSGDVSLVRSLLSRLKDHRLFVPKVFAFTEDTRPGYFGTWTRTSANIRLRRPFKRDPVAIDYGYDSGGEWEDETSGDGDDVVEDGDEDAETEEPDSDLDSWLVDDDEVIEVGTPPEERNGDSLPPNFLSTPSPPPKRKSDDECQRLGKKRKVVVPLVPFAKGPCWEQSVGQCEFDFFKPYQIQLFNGTWLYLSMSMRLTFSAL
jgi:chromatin assembly factor 1 subunit A